MLFPQPSWHTFSEQVAALPMSANGWKRLYLGNAQELELDSAGRMLVAPELRTFAGIVDAEDRSVVLIGMGSHFELWNAQRHAAHEVELLASEMPESLKDFKF